MAVSYSAKSNTATTCPVGHSWSYSGGSYDAWTWIRYYCQTDLSGYSGPPYTFRMATGTADGSIAKVDTAVPHGTPPDIGS
jgi:hypothetical protein